MNELQNLTNSNSVIASLGTKRQDQAMQMFQMALHSHLRWVILVKHLVQKIITLNRYFLSSGDLDMRSDRLNLRYVYNLHITVELTLRHTVRHWCSAIIDMRVILILHRAMTTTLFVRTRSLSKTMTSTRRIISSWLSKLSRDHASTTSKTTNRHVTWFNHKMNVLPSKATIPRSS